MRIQRLMETEENTETTHKLRNLGRIKTENAPESSEDTLLSATS
jgi:hypothetical protein